MRCSWLTATSWSTRHGQRLPPLWRNDGQAQHTGQDPAGETDKHGLPIDDHIYNVKDFDRTLVIDTRTQRVAKWITDYPKQIGNRPQKTIVFCGDTEPAALLRRALIVEGQDLVKESER